MTRYVLDIDDSQWKADHLPRVLRTAESEWLNELACQVEIQITDVSPLIVLDLENPAAVVRSLREATQNGADLPYLDQVAASIEAQTKPARIPEPGRVGKQVNAKSDVADPGYVRPWTRFSTILRANWIDAEGRRRKWSELIDPTLIREGVAS